MLGRKKQIVRSCSVIGLQGMTGYFIREKDIRAGDVTFLQGAGYQVYGIHEQENKPYTIEKRVNLRSRAGIVVFPAVILFPKRKGISRDSMMNYYTLNNQYSEFDYEIAEHTFDVLVNSEK